MRNRHAVRTITVVWLTLAISYGIFFSFSIFFVALLDEFHWSRALTAGAFSASTICQGVLAPAVGALIDRIGPRRVLAMGVVSLAASCLLAATITHPWQLYLTTGLLGALGIVGLGWVPMGVLLSRTFRTARGRMVGIAFSGMGFGVFAVGPIAQWLIGAMGWRFASATLGAGALVTLLPLVWLGTRHTEAPGADRERAAAHPSGTPPTVEATLASAMRTRAFWGLFSAYFLTPLAVFPVFIHQVAYAVDLGFARLLVASIFGLVGLMSVVGRPIFGVMTDRLGGPLAATISYACTAGGALALLEVQHFRVVAWLVAYAILFGLGFGARGPIITTMASQRFGGRRFGVIWGALNAANGVGGAAGPWFGGFVHDVSGSYRIVFFCSVAFSAMATACFWIAATERARRPGPEAVAAP